MRKFCIIPALALLTGPLALSAAAQTARTSDTVLDMITVIGTGLPTEVMRNPASVMLIEGAAIARQAPVTIAGLLRDVPGLQISEEGIERVSLRGEQSRRIAILLDGQALTDHGNYGQPIPVDPTQIERIQIVRGSSSVVSGNRAIGGGINIITKQGAAKPFEVTTNAAWFSATRGWRASVSAEGTLPLGAGEFDYRLSYGRMDQGNRRTPDGEIPNTDSSDRNRSAYMGYRLGDHQFGLRGQATDLAAGVYSPFPNAIITLPQRDLRKISVFYEGTDLTPWLDRLRVEAYRQTVDRRFTTETITPPTRMMNTSIDGQKTKGARLTAEMKLSTHSRTVAGLEYEDDRLSTMKTAEMQPPMQAWNLLSRSVDGASIRTFSLFAEHEVAITPSLTGNFGGRWYRVRANHDAAFSEDLATGQMNDRPTRGGNRHSLSLASAGLVWSPDETLALRANISQGHTYPTLGQLYLTSRAAGNTIHGNPDLKPERATTWEVGARLSQGNLDLDATLFHTNARDYITYFFREGSNEVRYDNVERARSWGLELQAEYASDFWDLRPYTSLAAIRRELRFENGARTTHSGTPRLSGRVGLRKTWSLADTSLESDLFIRGESATKLVDDKGNVLNMKDAAGWATLNFAVNMQWDNGLSLVVEANNLTNRRYHPFEQAPGAERSINIFLSRSF